MFLRIAMPFIVCTFRGKAAHQRIQKELLDWNLRYAAPLKKFIQPHKNDPNPERKLRIGYVSADFDYHASAYFLDPLLRNHNHEQFEIFCYANVAARIHIRNSSSPMLIIGTTFQH